MASSANPYSEKFYDGQVPGSLVSARIVVPLVLDLVPATSVCDVGCGMGTWLQAFIENGVDDVFGFDGNWVNQTALHIPKDRFRPADLAQPLEAGRRFDLASSLEVAEHLPEESAPQFVKSLTDLAPVVLFSAAIPHQGGTDHVNEQWPSYWAKLFASDGYVAVDCLRSNIWQNSDIEWWYRQNILIFANEAGLAQYEKLAAARKAGTAVPNSLVHPDPYMWKLQLKSS